MATIEPEKDKPKPEKEYVFKTDMKIVRAYRDVWGSSGTVLPSSDKELDKLLRAHTVTSVEKARILARKVIAGFIPIPALHDDETL